MNYVGLDVHQKQSTYCVLDAHGQKVRIGTVKGPWDKVLLDLSCRVPRPFAIVFEASLGFGVLHARLGQLAQRVVVAHPAQLRAIWKSAGI